MNIKELRKMASTARSLAEIARHLGLNPNSGQVYKKVHKLIEDNGISCPQLMGQGWSKGQTRDTSTSVDNVARKLEVLWKKVFCKNSDFRSRHEIIRRLLRSKHWDYACQCCGISEWQGQKLSLQLHHKNGIKNDHRIINLELLCPNCHSQTPTFAGRNNKIKNAQMAKFGKRANFRS